MPIIQIPYHDSFMELQVEDRNLAAVLVPGIHGFQPEMSESGLVRQALENPIGSPRLRDLARGKKNITLVTSDHTRAVPSKITLPLLLGEIRSGNPEANITILIATGLHRATTEKEQRQMFGDQIVDQETISINDAFCKEDFINICTLPSGAGFHVNKLAVNCDLLLCEGFIEPHFFAGFSGGRKSILPGICSQETVNENHSFRAIANPNSAAGVLEGNPIHEDMVYAARKINTAFTLNVALNDKKKIIAAFAGDLVESHEAGVAFIRSLSQCRPAETPIVVTGNGGYPLDQNLYQSPKAVATAEACAAKDGIIVMCCACSDGMGGEYFQELIVAGKPEAIEEKLAAIPPKETIPEQWCAQIYARILKKHQVILVTTFLDHDLVKKANMIPASSLDEAMKIAFDIKGADAKVTVIPDGVSVLAVKE